MEKNEQLQRLLRLKRHELPPEDFMVDFLDKFQRRQRTEVMQRSALSILWERLQLFVDGLRRPSVIWSAVGAYAVILFLMKTWPAKDSITSSKPVYILNQSVNANSVPVSQKLGPQSAVNQTSAGAATLPNSTIPAPPKGKRRTVEAVPAGADSPLGVD